MITQVVNNKIRNHIINSNIVEYNIRKAYPTILSQINKNEYGYLTNLSKENYVKEINRLFKENSGLKKEISDKTIEIYNEWFTKNKIGLNNFLASTTDSIILIDRLASNNTIDDIYFRNKDKLSYTSAFYVTDNIFILFDKITKTIKIHGFNDENINNYPFVKKILKELCQICNDFSLETKQFCLKKFADIRIKYINSSDFTIFGDITHFNEYRYLINDEFVYSPQLKDNNSSTLIIEDNYMNFMLPIMQSLL